MKYRVGWPGWKVAARHGADIYFVVTFHKDTEAGGFWAESRDLDGLVVTGKTIDELHKEVVSAASVLFELELGSNHVPPRAELRSDLQLCAA